MELQMLTAISPIDGRYRDKVAELGKYFSEFALIKYRLFVEVEYFIALTEIPLPQLISFPGQTKTELRKLCTQFSLEDASRIKEIEKITNHDVKAVEYFLKEKFDQIGLAPYKEFIHFGLTSQDINNTAVPCSLQDAIREVYLPAMKGLLDKLNDLSNAWKTIPMLAKTHGQPASPTLLGKEIKVFSERLEVQLSQLESIPCYAKFGGATGNLNAHHVAYPSIDWVGFSNRFVQEALKLERSQTTTQIAHYDNYAAIFDCMKRINTILIDLDRDFWTYVSMNYFKQQIKKGEIGSSAMPHKVNPIDFENSEGNLGVANALFEHLSAKLPISRLQRDLTDSTVLRNVGVPFAHTLLSIKSTMKGLGKLLLNEEAIKQDLEENWIVVAEAIQTILRREAYPNPYEALKELTRVNRKIDQNVFVEFINQLEISEDIKEELRKITPQNYTGVVS
ncbi:MAG: adenylosuccinate lyase [Prolixibacteraceae bacterium]